MRIDCPACAAGYEVPDALLTGGRSVRCARCGHQWHPDALPPPVSFGAIDEPRIAAPSFVPSAPSPAASLAAGPAAPVSRPPAAGASALVLAWVGSLLLLASAGAAAIALHRPIARAWPPSLRVYAALGLVHTAR